MSVEDGSCYLNPDNVTYSCTQAGPGPGYTYPPPIPGDAGEYCRINYPTLNNCPEWYTFEGVCYSADRQTLQPCAQECQDIDAVLYACKQNNETQGQCPGIANDPVLCGACFPTYKWYPCYNGSYASYSRCFEINWSRTQHYQLRSIHLPWYLFYLAIFGQIITLASCFSRKRKNLNYFKNSSCGFLNKGPGMFRIGDLNANNKNRLMWVSLFISTIEILVIIALFGAQQIPMPNPLANVCAYGGDPWIFLYNHSGILHRIVVIIFYVFFYGPIFVAVADQTLFNLSIGFLWILSHFCMVLVDIIFVTEMINIYAGWLTAELMTRIPTLLADLILVIEFGVRTFEKLKGYRKIQEKIGVFKGLFWRLLKKNNFL